MAINNEELLGKFVRTGMIMRHIDGDEMSGCRKHGPHGGHGGDCGPHAHGPHGEGRGHGPHGEGFGEGYGMQGEGHGPHGEGEHGHGHGHGHDGHECCCHGHGHGHGRKGGRRRGQARVLTMVSMQEGINQKDLAFLLGIRPQTLGELLQRLEERGLVAREKSATDGRAIQVTLTEEGRARAAEIAERRALAAADMFAVLTEEEKEQLASILDKLGAELDKHRPRNHCKHAGAGEEPNAPETE